MNHVVKKLTDQLTRQFDHIPASRKITLARLAEYVSDKYGQEAPVRLVFICTHNSRRSHFGQIAAAIAAEYYAIDQVETYSGGTEATAFHPNAIAALRTLGLSITTPDATAINPVWSVRWGVGEKSETRCFSKVYDDHANPSTAFAAVMTCSEAEQNCPYVPGTELRIATTYDDPKASDGTPEQEDVYRQRFQQIATEMLYAFSQVK